MNLILKKILLIIVIVVIATIAKATIVDSLLSIYSNEKGTERRIELLNKISKEYRLYDKIKSIDYGTHALELSIEKGSKLGEAEALYNIGRAYETHDDYNKAISYFSESLEKYHNTENENTVAYISYRIGTNYKKKGMYKKAMQYSLKSLRIYENIEDENGMASVYNCMGSIYKYQNEYDQALIYYNKCIDIKRELHGDIAIVPYYNNLGILYHLMGLDKLSLEYYEKSLSIHKANNDEKGIARLLTNIGNIYLGEGNSVKALELYLQSMEIREKLGYKKGIANSYHNLGNLYFESKDFEQAEIYLEKGLKLYLEIERLESLKGITKLLHMVNHEMDDHEKAYHYLLQNKLINDSIFNVEKTRDIAQLEFDYADEKRIEIDELKEQKANIIRMMMYSLLLSALIIVILLLGKQKNKNRRQKLEKENLRLEKENIESELKIKNKELVSNTLHLIQQSETNLMIIEKLQQAKYNLKKENQPVIQGVINDLKVKTDMDIWAEFEMRFLQVYDTFYENLQEKFPELTSNEKRISAFLRLDLSTKEISLITNQTPHSINIARSRLRKKLQLDNTDINLSDFLSRF